MPDGSAFQANDLRSMEIEKAWRDHHSGAFWRRGSWWAPMRGRLAEAQNWRCCWCYNPMDVPNDPDSKATIEHIVPQSLGGPDELENIAIACALCNHTRPSTEAELHRLARMFGLDELIPERQR